MKCQIDLELLKLKMLYFVMLGMYSSLIMYLNTFMDSWGITMTELAVINFFTHGLAFLLRPYMGYIADKHQNYKQILIFLSLLCLISFTLFLAVPKYAFPIIDYSLSKSLTVHTTLQNNTIEICAVNMSSNICWPEKFINCSNFQADQFVINQTTSSCASYTITNGLSISQNVSVNSFRCKNISQTCNSTQIAGFATNYHQAALSWSPTFWMLGILKFIGFGFFSPMSSLTDSMIFIILGNDRSHEYGFTRMFGTIGVLFFTVVTGISVYGMDRLKTVYQWQWLLKIQLYSEYTSCFIWGFLGFLIIIVIVAFIRNDKSLKKRSFKSKSCAWKFLEIMSLTLMFRDFRMGVFFLFSIFGGLVLGIHAEYYIVVINKLFPLAPKFLTAAVLFCMASSETLLLGISEKLLPLISYEIWVSLSFLMWSLRFFLYIFCTEYWHFILMEMIHGLTYGVQICAMMSFIGSIVALSDQGKVQGLFSSLFYNIGGCLGGLIGGLVLHNLGPTGLFKFISLFSLICGLTYYPVQVWIIGKNCITVDKSSEIELNGNLMENHKETDLVS